MQEHITPHDTVREAIAAAGQAVEAARIAGVYLASARAYSAAAGLAPTGDQAQSAASRANEAYAGASDVAHEAREAARRAHRAYLATRGSEFAGAARDLTQDAVDAAFTANETARAAREARTDAHIHARTNVDHSGYCEDYARVFASANGAYTEADSAYRAYRASRR